MPKRILIAPNAFKHSLSAIEVAKVVKSSLGLLDMDLKCEIAPIADGGDGTLEVIGYYFPKSKVVNCNVHDPLMRTIQSRWLLLDKETAVIELAKASGLVLLNDNELNPMFANTFGTGELILSALDKGCKKIIIALGGSATVDAGIGILIALGAKVFDKKKQKLRAGGGYLQGISEIDLSSIDKRLAASTLHVLCDTTIPLFGEKGTVMMFSTQKGAKEGEKIILENGMKYFSDLVKKATKKNYELEPMVGAAGGVAYTLKAFLNANLFSGFNYLAKLILLEEKVKNSDFIVTGEGKLDIQTISGKGVYELAKIAKTLNKHNVIALCGDYDENINWQSYNISHILKIKPDDLSIVESIKNAQNLIEIAVKNSKELFINY